MVGLVAMLGNTAFLGPQGPEPDRDLAVDGNKLVAKLTRSKTIGEDKKLRYRMVKVTECCFVSQPNWRGAFLRAGDARRIRG